MNAPLWRTADQADVTSGTKPVDGCPLPCPHASGPGLSMSGARYLVENGAMIIGADNLSLEAFPSQVEDNYIPVHTYLLAQHGIPIMEIVDLESIAADRLFEFAFIGASLKPRGADAAPMRRIAIPVRQAR